MVDEVELGEEHLISVFNNVKKQAVNVEDVGKGSFEHLLSETLKDAAAKRRDQLVSLRLFAEGSRRSVDSAVALAGKKVCLWFKPYRKSFSYPGVRPQTHTVLRLQTLMKDGDGIEESLEIIGCKELFDDIVSDTKRIAALTVRRGREVARKKKEAELKRKKAYEELKALLITLENLANMDSDDREMYQRLCLDLLGIITQFHAVWKSRITAKRGKDDGVVPSARSISNVEELSEFSDEVYDDEVDDFIDGSIENESNGPAESKKADDNSPAY